MAAAFVTGPLLPRVRARSTWTAGAGLRLSSRASCSGRRGGPHWGTQYWVCPEGDGRRVLEAGPPAMGTPSQELQALIHNGLRRDITVSQFLNTPRHRVILV